MKSVDKRSGRLAWIWVALVWLGIWQGAYLLVGQDLLLASPWQVLRRLSLQSVRSSFWLTVLYSFLRIQAGFLLGLACGTLLAVLTVRLSWTRRFFHPAISPSGSRSLPLSSWRWSGCRTTAWSSLSCS